MRGHNKLEQPTDGYPESHIMFWTETQRARKQVMFDWVLLNLSNLSRILKDFDEGLALYESLKKPSAPPSAQRGPEDTSALWHFG